MKLPFLKGRLARRGWEYRDTFPHHLPQYVLIAGPHTSWRDFFVALCIREDLGLHDLKILAKHSLFWWPLGPILRSLGAIPVNRSSTHGLVDQMAAHFAQNPTFKLGLAPEGTRGKVHGLKSGYRNIAEKAGVPIVTLGMDFGRKVVSVAQPIQAISSETDDHRVLEILGPLEGAKPELGLNHLTPDRAQRTLPEQLAWNASRFPHRLFLDEPHAEAGSIRFTHGEVYAEAKAFASGLHALGIQPGDKVAIIGKNSAHWLIADYGCALAGAVSVPMYPTIDGETAQKILEHSESKVLVIGKLDDASVYIQHCPADVRRVFIPYMQPDKAGMNWEALKAKGRPDFEPVPMDPEALMTIIYTSGTTGMPKGVMHNFKNFQAAFRMILEQFNFLHQEVFVSYLPLSHVAERMIISAAGVYLTGRIHFVQALDTFAKNLEDAQPTVFMAVPRIWEKFGETIHAKIPAAFLRQLLSPILRKKLGLSRARLVLSGAAPIRATLLEDFAKMGIAIQEVYGMTENLGISTVNFRGKVKMGTVGQAFSGVEVFLGDGNEVLVKGPTCTQGYYKEPEKTAELYAGGPLHTGDCGSIDSEGYLTITGRIKDIFKTSKGKYVAPAPIENRLMVSEHMAQVCVVGLDLAQPIALAVLTEDARKLPEAEVIQATEELLQAINQALPSHEKLDKVLWVPEDWSVENGFLTPTLKIKRNVVESYYKEAAYAQMTSAKKVSFLNA
ncbi:MAG: hypothetical protein RL168_903 [Bacteroidota bacterium]